MNIKSHLIAFGAATLALILSLAVVVGVIDPVQKLYFPQAFPLVNLIFLPHGVILITAWLFGAWSIPYLFFGSIISELLLRGIIDPEAAFITSIVGYVSFELLRLSGLDMYKTNDMKSTHVWRYLLLVTFVASFFNRFTHQLFIQPKALPESPLHTIFFQMVGDIAGTLALFLMAMFISKLTGLSVIKIRG